MLINDIKPYKPLAGRVARIQYQASKLHGKRINVQYRPRMTATRYDREQFEYLYRQSEDDLIQDQAIERGQK